MSFFQKLKSSIGFQIILSFWFIISFSILGFALAVNSFSNVRQAQNLFVSDTLPLVFQTNLLSDRILEYELVLDKLRRPIIDENVISIKRKIYEVEGLIEQDIRSLQERFSLDSSEFQAIDQDLKVAFSNASRLQNITFSQKPKLTSKIKEQQSKTISSITNALVLLKKWENNESFDQRQKDVRIEIQDEFSNQKNIVYQVNNEFSKELLAQLKLSFSQSLSKISKLVSRISDPDIRMGVAQNLVVNYEQVEPESGLFFNLFQFKELLAEQEVLLLDYDIRAARINSNLRILLDEIEMKTRSNANALKLQNSSNTVIFYVVALAGLISSILILVCLILPKIIKRLERLSVQTDSVMHGDFDQDIDVSGDDEISKMAQALERLKSSLLENSEMGTEIENARQFQNLIFSNIPDLLFVKDKEFKIVEANPKFLELYPKNKRDQVLGFTTLEDYDEAEAKEILKFDRIAFEEGQSETEETILFPDGVQRTLFTKKVRFENDFGDEYILGIARDITPIKHFQSEIEQQKSLLELAENTARLGHWHVNLKTDKVFWSDQVYVIHGVSKEDYLPEVNTAIDFYHPDDQEVVEVSIQNTIENKEPFEFDLRIINADGKTVYVQSMGVPEVDEKGNVIGLFGIFQDITERKLFEEEILRSNEALDDFAYISSHDLKEPLRGLHNHARFLLEDYEDKLDKDGVHKLHRIMYLSQRMEQLTSDLLYFSRLGRSDLNIEPVDMNVMVEGMRELYADHENFDLLIKDTLPLVLCDKIRTEEVFRNLISNGIKYNDSEQKVVEIGVQNVTYQGPNQKVMFYVKDNGIGIDPKFHESVFKIFKRLHAKDDYGGGTGSGLTFVEKIVEKHGGKIWVESELGQGAVFYFTLGAKA